jgi:hypothetical protein
MKVPFASRYTGFFWTTLLAAEPGGLRLEMTGNLLIEPALELGGEGKDFDGHGFTSFQVSVSPFERPASYRDTGLFVFD